MQPKAVHILTVIITTLKINKTRKVGFIPTFYFRCVWNTIKYISILRDPRN